MLGGGIYPGMITATVGTALLIAVVGLVGRDRQAPPPLRGLVRRPPHRLRRRSRSPGSTRSRPGTSSCSTRSPPTTGARSTSRRSALLVGFRLGVPLVNALPLPAARRRGRRRRAPGVVSLRITGRAARPPRRPGRAVLPLALPRPAAAGGRRTRSRSRPRRTAARSGSRSRPRRLHRASIGDDPAGTRVVAEGPFGVFTDGRAPARQGRC